jgi:DNA-binding NarL/FixJ family response regulator
MKILLADDHALIRSGLRNELEELQPVIEFVEAWDLQSLHRMLELHGDLDLALVDLTMPGMEGAQTIGALRRRYPAIPMIVLSGVDVAGSAQAVLRAGASGFIPKTAMSKVMLQAIRLVLAGGQYLPPQMLHALDRDPPGITSDRATSPGMVERALESESRGLRMLSERQRQVFALLARGLSNKMIARELNVTEGTVKTHVATIFDVLNVHNRVSAIAKARALALEQDAPPSSSG